MLRFLVRNQQRSFHQSATQWNYTRTALRRLKKPELVAMAGQHKLDSTGTKNDLIDRLLTTPTQQSNTTTTTTTTTAPTPDSPAQLENLSSTPPPPPILPTTSSSIDTESINVTTMTETPSSSIDPESINVTTMTETPSTPDAILTDSIEDTSVKGYDQQWVEAFDLKVGNRRSGLERTSPSMTTRQQNQQHHNKHHLSSSSSSSDAATSSSTHPAYVHQTIGVHPSNNNNPISMSAHRPTADDEPMDPEINQHWVKVFDQRVKTRTKIMGLNTLDINASMPSPTIESTPTPSTSTSDPATTTTTTTKSTGNKAVSIAVGTSLATWYFLGTDGIQAALSAFFS